MDILCREFRYFIERRGISEDTPRSLIIEHLKCLSSHDLEPVDYAFDAGIGIEMGVGYYFLLEWDVFSCPAEKDGTRDIYHSDKDRGIYC